MLPDLRFRITAQGATAPAFAQVRNDVARTNGLLARARVEAIGLGAAFRGLGGVVGGVFAGREFVQLLDASTRIQNSLKVAGLSGEDLTRVYDRLFESAQRNAAPIEALVDLYGRAALVQKELGISSEELLGFTDKVAVALRVSGKSAQESSGALLQLSQALGSGIVRAEEFNSILEGALPIAQAAAAGLQEAGGSVAKLRQLVVDGKVSSEAFFRAFEAGSSILTDKVAGAEFTVSSGLVRLQNVMVDAAGRFDDVTGASSAAAAGLDAVATVIQTITDRSSPFMQAIEGYIDGVDEMGAATRRFVNDPSLKNFWTMMVGGGSGETGVITGRLAEVNRQIAEIEANAFGPGSTENSRGIASGLLATLRAEAELLNKDLTQVNRTLTAAYDPLSSAGTGLAAEASPSGSAVNPVTLANYPLSASGDSAAKTVKGTTTAVGELYDSLEVTRDLTRDWLDEFANGLMNGGSLIDSLSDAAKGLGAQLLRMGINTIVGSIFPTPGAAAGLYHSGGVAGFPATMRTVNPAIFAGAPRMHGGGIAGLGPDEVPAILQRGERVLPRGASGGGGMVVNYAPQIDARGADRSAIEALTQRMQRQIREELPEAIRRARAARKL